MKTLFLLCALLFRQTQTTVPVEAVSKYIGKIIKLNCNYYQTIDNGRTVTFILHPQRAAKPVTISISGEARKKMLNEMRIRRHLNRQIASPLDTSLTVAGKIILTKDRLMMVVSRTSDIYLGADLEEERP